MNFELSSFSFFFTRVENRKSFDNRKSPFLSTCNFQFMPSREHTKKNIKLIFSSIFIADDWKLISQCIQKEKFCNCFFASGSNDELKILVESKLFVLTAECSENAEDDDGRIIQIIIYSSCYHSLRKIYNFLQFLLII